MSSPAASQSREARPSPPAGSGGRGKTRLMQITHDLALGGLQRVVVNICRSIDRERFEVSVLCLKGLGAFAREIVGLGIPVYCLPQPERGTDYLSFLKVAGILRRERINVIHTHNTQPFIEGTLAALLAGVRTVVHTDHGRVFPDKRRYMIAERLASRFAVKVVGVSDVTAQQLVQYEKIPPQRVTTILNGIDGEAFAAPVDREAKRRELGVAGRGPLLGIVSRLVAQKGIVHLIEALPLILREHPEATVVIAGEGELDGGAHERYLREQACALGVQDHVLFIGPRCDVPALLQAFDLIVLTSAWEGLPLVILEAMAAGCPIVAPDVGGIRTAVTHGKTGMLADPTDRANLAEAVGAVLRDGALRESLILAGRETFAARFSARTMTQNYERLYLHKGPKFARRGE